MKLAALNLLLLALGLSIPDVSAADGPATLPAPLYGVTLDDVSQLSAIMASLSHLPYKPTVRVVYDPGTPISDYQTALKSLHTVAFVMVEVLDSYYFPNSCGAAVCDVAQYKSMTQTLVNGLGSMVDVWEIANEINGEWLRPDQNGTTTQIQSEETLIGQKVAAAYQVVHAAGGKTAVTLWYNFDGKNNCWSSPMDNWTKWAQTYLPATVTAGVDYALFSYYPVGDCPGLTPNWNNDFTTLGQIFPNARLGFGEIGTASISEPQTTQDNLITTYYPMVTQISNPRFVGGFFWWNYAEEMLPYTTSSYWSLLNKTISALPQPR